MRKVSIIVLIYRKLGSVRPVQQKIKLPLPNADRSLLKQTGQIKTDLVTTTEGNLTTWVRAIMVN